MKRNALRLWACAACAMCLPLQVHATPLDDAAKAGDVAKVESLIAKGADINERDRAKKTALWWAADSRQTDAVRVLLDKGADPNLADFDGTTPLGVAALNGNEPVVLLLLAHHANVNAVDTTGVRPLDYAVRLGFADITETLRSAGAKCGDNEAYSKACKEAQ